MLTFAEMSYIQYISFQRRSPRNAIHIFFTIITLGIIIIILLWWIGWIYSLELFMFRECNTVFDIQLLSICERHWTGQALDLHPANIVSIGFVFCHYYYTVRYNIQIVIIILPCGARGWYLLTLFYWHHPDNIVSACFDLHFPLLLYTVSKANRMILFSLLWDITLQMLPWNERHCLGQTLTHHFATIGLISFVISCKYFVSWNIIFNERYWIGQ